MISEYDEHVSKEELRNAIAMKRIILLFIGGQFEGWLRFNLFWDNIPFMNLLFILEEQRGKGYGRKLVEFWEHEMAKQGYKFVMTSSLSDEHGQFFYRKLGYIGGAIHHIGSVHKYAREEDVPEHTIFVITTDGMENASHHYNSDQVKQMVKRQKEKYGWEFLFLGANIDAVETAAYFGISEDRAVNFHICS